MKFINKILLVSLIVFLGACDSTELDLLDNPNEVTPENASVNDLYNNIQLSFKNVFAFWQDDAGAMARMYHNNSYSYLNATSPTTLSGMWNIAYAGMFPDIDALLPLAEERGLDIHAGSIKILKAYVLMVLVDLMGNVPYTEAGGGTDIISPVADNGADVYAAAIGLLDEAISQLRGTSAGGPAVDQFYNGDPDKWITLANTLKLRAAVTTRLVDGSAASTINSLINDDIIDESAEDFQFNYGSTRTNPDSRHPFYQNHYEAGDGTYMSNYYMWMLAEEKMDDAGEIIRDPRIRFYFYRKIEKSAEQDPNTYGCHFSTLPDQDQKPAHYVAIDPRLPYCIATADGYSGRDFLNGEGIPPDGPTRTSYGLYPGGGQFDWNEFKDTRQSGTTGALGAGIEPIMLASFVDFMRAEAALTLGTNDDPRELLESGMRKSIEKVFSFKNLVPATMSTQIEIRGGGTTTVEERWVPTEEEIEAYIDFVLSEYDEADADDKLNIVIKEYYIALWGNGYEAYNMWRRTGKPGNMAPALEPVPGPFLNSFFLPDVHVNRNANATQKEITDRVFWDDGSANVY